MAKLQIVKASTNVTQYIFIQDSSSTTGAGLTGLVFNTASLVCYYVRPLAVATVLTLATQTVTGAHSDGGFVEIDSTNMPGLYRLDLSDAICATGVDSVVVMLKGAANMAPVLLEIQLTSVNFNNGVTGGIAALPSAAPDAAGGLPISDAGGLDLDAMNTNINDIETDTNELQTDWANGGRLDLILDARASQTTADAIETDTQDIQTRLPAALVGGLIDANVGAISTDTAAADNLELDYDGTGYNKANSTIGTTTTNTDMRGTDSAATAAQVNTEVSDVLKVDTISENAQQQPPTTPTFEEAVMYLYMALRNKIDVTSTLKEFHNDAGTVIWKKTLSDDGVVYSEAKGASGP